MPAMDFPVNTPGQVKAVLRALRKSRGLSQAALGARLGVNQKRIARIEAAPGVTGFDQISRFVSALGARLVIQDPGVTASGSSGTAGKKAGEKR
jgi:HTH-type transcriptional regulator/antitoxin HipB